MSFLMFVISAVEHLVSIIFLLSITVNPETYEVKADGVLLKCEPAKELPLTQRYNLF